MTHLQLKEKEEDEEEEIITKITSNTPSLRPSFPKTPASSITSRIAVMDGSSSGSTPPPGTIQWSGRLDDVTNNTCATEE